MMRLVLFDIDGTLVCTGGAGSKALDRAFASEFGVRDAIRHINIAGRTDTSVVRECFRAHRIPETDGNFRRFFDSYVFLLQAFLEQSPGTVCAGVIEFIRDLQALPSPPTLGLLTGNIRLGAEIKLRHYLVWDYFELGAFGDDHEDRNHLAALAKGRAERVQAKPLSGPEVLVVGDTPHDVTCAQAIGAPVLAVGTGSYTCDELKACSPTWVVKTLSDISAREVCFPPNRPKPAAAA